MSEVADEVVQENPTGIADEVIQAASNEIAEYNPVEAGLADLRKRLKDVSYDLTTVKGMAVAKADRAEVRGLRTGLEAKRKEVKAPALAHCKRIDDEAARITKELLLLETPIDAQIKARETVLEKEKADRELAERNRITAIHKRIADIREFVALAAGCRTAARVDDLLTKLSLTSLADFEEFGDEAAAAHLDAMERVAAILDTKKAQEAEQARIKQEQADAAAKLAADQAEQAAAAAKLAAERAEFEAAQAAAKLKAEQDAAAAKAEADRLETERQAKVAAEVAELTRQRAEAQAELDRQLSAIETANAVAQAAAEAQRAALAAERAEFEAQQAAAKQAAEQEAAEKAAKEAQALEEQAQVATQTIAPEVIEQIEAAVAVVDANQPPAPTEQGQVATETVAADPREETAMWNAITDTPPGDADVMWIAISAVAKEYGWTTEQATQRMSEIDWTL